MTLNNHKSGFVAIVGKPNAGKSTLLNAFLGEKLSIVTPKAQTTRHRILGILNDENFQIVFSDTPGIIKPKYELQKSMMKFVSYSLEDADLIICVVDANDAENPDEDTLSGIGKIQALKILVINKIDISTETQVSEKQAWGQKVGFFKEIIQISALTKINVNQLLNSIVGYLPEHPAYYDKEDLSDRTERFFAAEIIREKIFLNYQQEIPYSCEVIVSGFKDKPDISVVSAEIIVERDSQKGIIIGKNGESLKKISTQARLALEEFLGKKVFLETHVRVVKDWRSNPSQLKKFGYEM